MEINIFFNVERKNNANKKIATGFINGGVGDFVSTHVR